MADLPVVTSISGALRRRYPENVIYELIESKQTTWKKISKRITKSAGGAQYWEVELDLRPESNVAALETGEIMPSGVETVGGNVIRGDDAVVKAQIPIASYYCGFTVDGRAQRAIDAGDTTLLVRYVEFKAKRQMKELYRHLNGALYRRPTGALFTIQSAAGSVLTLRRPEQGFAHRRRLTTQHLRRGMYANIFDEGGVTNRGGATPGFQIRDYDPANHTVTLDRAAPVVSDLDIGVRGTDEFHSSRKELIGFPEHANNAAGTTGATICGVSRIEYPEAQATVLVGTGYQDLTDALVDRMMGLLAFNSGEDDSEQDAGGYDIVACSKGVARAAKFGTLAGAATFTGLVAAQRTGPNQAEGGAQRVVFHTEMGPVTPNTLDIACDPNVMYLIRSKDLRIYQVEKPKWLQGYGDLGGGVPLIRDPRRDRWSANYCWDLNLFCVNWPGMGLIDGLNQTIDRNR